MIDRSTQRRVGRLSVWSIKHATARTRGGRSGTETAGDASTRWRSHDERAASPAQRFPCVDSRIRSPSSYRPWFPPGSPSSDSGAFRPSHRRNACTDGSSRDSSDRVATKYTPTPNRAACVAPYLRSRWCSRRARHPLRPAIGLHHVVSARLCVATLDDRIARILFPRRECPAAGETPTADVLLGRRAAAIDEPRHGRPTVKNDAQ